MENHIIQIHLSKNSGAQLLASAKLRIRYAMWFYESTVVAEGNGNHLNGIHFFSNTPPTTLEIKTENNNTALPWIMGVDLGA